MAEIKETPLTSIHKEHGAKIVPFAGYAMPIQYTGVIAEHGFVRNHAGMFDVSHMGHCTVTGDTVSHLLSRPLSKIPEGKSRYLLIMNEKGGIIDDCIAYRTSVNTWHIVLNASRKEIDLDVLQDAVPHAISGYDSTNHRNSRSTPRKRSRWIHRLNREHRRPPPSNGYFRCDWSFPDGQPKA